MPVDGARRATVRIAVLGSLSVTVQGVDTPVGGPTQRRLVTALAIAAVSGLTLTVTDLIDQVYADDLPPRPRRSLATLVWRLRHRWGSESIAFDGYAYRLEPDRCVVDAEEFENLVYRGRELARDGQIAEALAALRASLALWRDPQGPDPAVPEPERIRLVELRLGAMDRLAQILAQSGRHSAAIELLERVVAIRPEWEHSQAQLIDCQLETGAVADGLRVYDSARRGLTEQGVEPGPDLERAAARLSNATGPAAARSHPSTPRSALPTQRVGGRPPGHDDMVGRAREWDDAVSSVTAALAARRSAAVVLSGEPGIGKSTLARAVLSAIAGGQPAPRVVRLACDPRRTLPYAPLAPLVAGSGDGALAEVLSGGAAALDDAGQIQASLLDRVHSMAESSGLVLHVEDLHWAPGETVAALAAVLAGAVDLPVVLLATTREGVIPDGLAPHVSRHLRLRGLGVQSVAELIGADPGAAQAVQMHRLTGGNPLYLRQMRQSGAARPDRPPEDVEAAIGAHLRIIPQDVHAALEVAAVVGDQFGVAVLAALTGPLRQARPIWIDLLAAATRLGLIEPVRESVGEFAFVHTLVREHLYRRMPAERRTVAHAEIGRALGRIALGRRCPADLLAHHYTRGWPEITTGEVVETLVAAAHAASVQLDFAQALGHYRSALDHLAMDPDADHRRSVADILGAAAGAAAAAGDLAEANELYESQRAFAQDAGLTRAWIFAALGALRTQFARRARPQVADNLAAALDDATASGRLRDCPGLVGEALAAVQVYRPHRAEQLLAEIDRREPDLAAGLQLAVWEHRTVSDQLTLARRLSDDPTADPVAVWLRLWVSGVAAGQRALDDPPPCPVPPSHADDQTQFDISQWRIATLTATGRLRRAQHLIDQALAAPRHPDPAENARRMASFYGQRTMLALVRNQLPAAQHSPEITNPTWASRHPIMRYVTAYMLSLGGEQRRARDLCDDLLDEVRDADIPESDLLPRLMLLTDACVRSGHEVGLEPCLRLLLPHRGEHGIFRFGQYWGAADQSIGELELELGDIDGGIASLRCAVNELDEVHGMLHQPVVRRLLADALDRRGGSRDRAEALAARHRADSTDRRLGLLHRLCYPDRDDAAVALPTPRASAG